MATRDSVRLLAVAGVLAWMPACWGALPRAVSVAAPGVQGRPGTGEAVQRVVSAPYVAAPLVPPASSRAGGGRVVATPVARVTILSAVTDPAQIVEGSGRTGCNFSFQAAIAGVLEYLFPANGLFRAGEPLFRLYDPAVLQDLALAERAARLRDAGRYLVAGPEGRYPMGGRVAVPYGGIMVTPARALDFPSPVQQAAAVPLSQPAPASQPRRHAPTPRPQQVGTKQAERAELTVAPTVRRPSRLQEAAVDARRDLGRFERAVSDAESALAEAEAKAGVCQEDFDAKSRLVGDGALPSKVEEDAADRLTQAESRVADCRMRAQIARGRLADERASVARAESIAQAAEQAAADEPTDVEVIRGTGTAPAAADVEVVRGASGGGAGTGQAPTGQRNSDRWARDSVSSGGGPAPSPARAGRPGLARRPAAFAFQQASGAPHGMAYRGLGPMVQPALTGSPQAASTLTSSQWTDYRAPTDGCVVACRSPQGSLVQPGAELLHVVNTQWARAYLPLTEADARRFCLGTAVSVTFDGYPDVWFEGWVSALGADPRGEGLRAELVVFCRQGYYGTDAYATLQWLALATPLDQSGDAAGPAQPAMPRPSGPDVDHNVHGAISLVPPDLWSLRQVADARPRETGTFVGQLQLVDLQGPGPTAQEQALGRERLAKLKRWRDGFTEGMMRSLFDGGVMLTYPTDSEVRRAVERMATGQVTHVPNRCARTMREALGWGLGDAHEWAYELPSCGWQARTDGLARPGDILVWPFTYPPRGSQHIGMAVEQNGRLMLLSNLDGYLGTTPIVSGYVAFHKSDSKPG
jgi:hypothetical protein